MKGDVDWLAWIPVMLSACTLIFNVFFYMYFRDYLAFKYTRMNDLAKISAEFLTYLSEVVSEDDFNGVPTKIRNYSEQILLCFKSDDDNISNLLEDLFQMSKERKGLNSASEIVVWNDNFRKKVSSLQMALRKHCGVL